MTIGNGAGTVAVGVLVLLSQASDGTPSSSRPVDGAVGRQTVGLAPAPTSPPEARRNVETSAPNAKPLTAASPAPVGAPPSPKSPPPPRELAQPQKPPEQEGPPSETAPPNPAPPNPAPPAKAETLDLGALEKRLRETKAIGVFTKLSLKNQVDDLLEQFREFHKARDQALLAKLREAFDLLLLKVLSLLQDGDPALARDISASRDALWNLLLDPDTFKSL